MRQQSQRNTEESLEVLYVDEVENETHEQENGEDKSISSEESSSRDKKTAQQAKEIEPQQQQSTPSATIAERETQDPLLTQEDSTSMMILNLSLSIATQRFLALVAALLGMVLTAHQMSENPDGLYASLCRSILTAIRTICRIVTCKPCCYNDGRRSSAHRHIPVSTMEYGYKVNDPSSVESFQ